MSVSAARLSRTCIDDSSSCATAYAASTFLNLRDAPPSAATCWLTAPVCTRPTLAANVREHLLSAPSALSGDTATIIAVLQLPPKQSCSCEASKLCEQRQTKTMTLHTSLLYLKHKSELGVAVGDMN